MTRRAKDTGLTTVVKPETAPHLLVLPSIIEASISTVPCVVKTDPLPALKSGWFSSSRTLQISQRSLYRILKLVLISVSVSSSIIPNSSQNYPIKKNMEKERRTTSSATSKGGLPDLRAETPRSRQCRRAVSRGIRRSSGRSIGISPAPPCSAIAHPTIARRITRWLTFPDYFKAFEFTHH